MQPHSQSSIQQENLKGSFAQRITSGRDILSYTGLITDTIILFKYLYNFMVLMCEETQLTRILDVVL